LVIKLTNEAGNVPFALPTPVLTGSGYVSMFSVPELRDTPLQNFHYKGIREFFLCKKRDVKKEEESIHD